MSEALIMPPAGETAVKRAPTVYFIDDSATMREVIKIAFRRENINVITCADAASALAQFEQNRPDVVITDVIMPNHDVRRSEQKRCRQSGRGEGRRVDSQAVPAAGTHWASQNFADSQGTDRNQSCAGRRQV